MANYKFKPDKYFNWAFNKLDPIYKSIKQLSAGNPMITEFPNIFALKARMPYGKIDTESQLQFYDRIKREYGSRGHKDLQPREIAEHENMNKEVYDELLKWQRTMSIVDAKFGRDSEIANWFANNTLRPNNCISNCIRCGLKIDHKMLLKYIEKANVNNFADSQLYNFIENLNNQMLVVDTVNMFVQKYNGINPNDPRVMSLISPLMGACKNGANLTKEQKQHWINKRRMFNGMESYEFDYKTFQAFTDDCKQVSDNIPSTNKPNTSSFMDRF